MSEKKPILAFVIPAFNEQENILFAIIKLNDVLSFLFKNELIHENSFMLFVDDGSTDSTWDLIEYNSKINKLILGIKLSRNYGHQTALMAGLSSVRNRCDCVISIDVDLQQDPFASESFIKEFIKGYDVVIGVRNDRKSDSRFKKNSSQIFYALMKMMGVNIIPNHADYRLLSNRANKALCEYIEPELFIRAAVLDIGFKISVVYFNVTERLHGESKYSFNKMFRLAYTAITSFSVIPLRMISIIGFFVFCISLIMAFYVFFHVIFFKDTVPGWASTILPIYFLGGIQILCLGVFGEYIGRIYFTVKGRPRWLIDHFVNVDHHDEKS